MATAAAEARRTALGLRQLVPLPIPGSSLARHVAIRWRS